MLQFGYDIARRSRHWRDPLHVESSTTAQKPSKKPLYAIKHLRGSFTASEFSIESLPQSMPCANCDCVSQEVSALEAAWGSNGMKTRRFGRDWYTFQNRFCQVRSATWIDRIFPRRTPVSFSLIGCRQELAVSVAAKSHPTQDHSQ